MPAKLRVRARGRAASRCRSIGDGRVYPRSIRARDVRGRRLSHHRHRSYNPANCACARRGAGSRRNRTARPRGRVHVVHSVVERDAPHHRRQRYTLLGYIRMAASPHLLYTLPGIFSVMGGAAHPRLCRRPPATRVRQATTRAQKHEWLRVAVNPPNRLRLADRILYGGFYRTHVFSTQTAAVPEVIAPLASSSMTPAHRGCLTRNGWPWRSMA